MNQRILTLFKKELQTLWRDKKTRFTLIIPTLMQLFLFSYAITLEVKNINLVILNKDMGKYSQSLIESFKGTNAVKNIYFAKDANEMRDYVSNKEYAAINFLPDFSKNIYEGKTSSLQIILNSKQSNSAQLIQGYINNVVNRFNTEIIKSNKVYYKQIKSGTIEVIAHNFYNPNLEFPWYNVPALMVILLMMGGMTVTSLSLAREKELGTYDQLLVSPLKPYEITIGKAMPALLIGLFQGSLIVILAIYFFKIPFTGSIFWLYISMIVYLLSVIGIGLLISTIAKTQQQAILGTFFFSSPAIMLSGFSAPIDNMPNFLQYLTLINPLRYFLTIIHSSFLKSGDFHIIITNLWPMVLIAIFTLSSPWILKNRIS